MKNILILLLLLTSTFVSAQIMESEENLSLGEQNAYVVDHMGAEKKMVEKIIEKTFKQYGKVKRNRKAKEWSCSDCQVSQISSSPINVYYKVFEGKGQITSYLFFDDGTKFISSDNDESASKAIKMLNMEIYYQVKRETIQNILEEEEKDLKKLTKALSKLEKKNSNLHNDIEEYKEKILKAEKEIEQNLADQQDKNMEIGQQKSKIEKTTEKLNAVGRKDN